MELREYQIKASRTCPALDSNNINNSPNMLDNLHMVLGMLTEVGELADVFKKSLAYNKPVDWINVEEELADVMWYLVNFARINNLSLEKSMTNNINKLQIRYPDKFDADLAINRNTELERTELEKNDQLNLW